MNRLALALIVLAAPGLVFVALAGTSQLVPTGVPVGLVVIGVLAALAGAGVERTRVHGAGVGLAVLGLASTGVGLSTPVLALGVASATLLFASLNLHLTLPEEDGGLMLILATVLSAALVAGVAMLLARLAAWLGGGGVDAAGGLAAWLVLLAAVTWGMARWVQEARPR